MGNVNKLHILYIITKLELGGAQKVCLSLMRGLKESGNNIKLISGTDGILTNELKDSPDIIMLANFKREVSIFYIFKEIKNFIELIKKIRELKKIYPNLIIHTHSTKAGLLGRWAGLFAGVKNRIHTIHGYGFNNYQNKLTWLFTYLPELITSVITTHFICVSSEDVKTGIKLLPNFKNKHSIIRAAVEWEKFYPTKRIYETKDKFIFGTISCFKKQKNLIDLFKAFKLAYQENNNCALEVIGDGELRPELESWITQNNLENQIVLHGWKHNVAEIMINWDAFVLSSLWEGLPCAIIEARLLKLPILSYKTGGISDVISQGKNGFLFEQGNWQELSMGMQKLMKNKKLCYKLKNYKEDLTDFKDSVMLQKHINLYKKFTNF